MQKTFKIHSIENKIIVKITFAESARCSTCCLRVECQLDELLFSASLTITSLNR